jgi:hypothetical protein
VWPIYAPLRKPTRIKYGKDGRTLTTPRPYTYDELKADAEYKIGGHSKKLGRNIVKLEGKKRPDDIDAHHIVSSTAKGAQGSRRLLFDWHIGINDADNGVFLPALGNVRVWWLTNAPWHKSIHVPGYHSRVFAVLLQADRADPEAGRTKLRTMKADMRRGKFRYT